MIDAVKEKTSRAEKTRLTRRRIVAAAADLFLDQGYGATTLDQIAARAGVSKPTVFSAVGNKQTVLSAVRDVAMAGDDQKLSMVERPLAEQIRQEPDPYRAVELLAGLFTGIGRRYARIDEVLRGAAQSGEPGLRELWQTSEEQRLTGARIWATSLAGKGPLRDGVDVDTATDLLWLYMAPDLYHRLVHDRGWSDERFQRWLVDTLTGLLLPPRPND